MQGLPVVTAPEEAEAVMAVLEQAGLVDACATSDGDVLVFGASTVYHTLKLQVGPRLKGRRSICCISIMHSRVSGAFWASGAA